MMLYFDNLSAWRFQVREEPAGTFVFTGWRDDEPCLELTGTDTTALVEQCRREAERLEAIRTAARQSGGRNPR